MPVLCGAASLYLGKDANWDLRNYHYYNAYAFLTGRLAFDIAPAQMQSYLNPLLDLPFFWLSQTLEAKTVGFILGFVHGLNLVLVLTIFRQMTSYRRWHSTLLVGFCVCLVSALAPAFLGELGTTMNDNLVSIFVLTAIVFINCALDQLRKNEFKNIAKRQMLVAGLVMGIAVGLKLTAAIFAIGCAVGLFFVLKEWPKKLTLIALFAVGGFIGVLLSSGFWFITLWSTFDNPLFPFYNNIFKSELVTQTAIKDTRFLPDHIWEYFVWPVIFNLDSQRVLESKFEDYRFLVMYFLTLSWVAHKALSAKSRVANFNFESHKAIFLILFFVTTFVVWMQMFSIYRYVITLELILPLVFLAIVERLVSSQMIRLVFSITTMVIILTLLQPFSYARVQWSKQYLDFQSTIPMSRMDNAVVIMVGHSPMAYVIPFFPDSTRFIRVDGNLRLNQTHGLFQMAKNIAATELEGNGNIYSLSHNVEKLNLNKSLGALGVEGETGECFIIKVNRGDQMRLCKIRQSPLSHQAGLPKDNAVRPTS